jgi:excisionase family DNA binding protein
VATKQTNAGDRLLTTSEVAAYLGVPTRTVEAWRYKRTGPPGIRLGRHVRYRKDDVDVWLDVLSRALDAKEAGRRS